VYWFKPNISVRPIRAGWLLWQSEILPLSMISGNCPSLSSSLPAFFHHQTPVASRKFTHNSKTARKNDWHLIDSNWRARQLGFTAFVLCCSQNSVGYNGAICITIGACVVASHNIFSPFCFVCVWREYMRECTKRMEANVPCCWCVFHLPFFLFLLLGKRANLISNE